MPRARAPRDGSPYALEKPATRTGLCRTRAAIRLSISGPAEFVYAVSDRQGNSAYQSAVGYDAFNPGTNFYSNWDSRNENGVVFFRQFGAVR